MIKNVVRYVDDLDGTEATERVRFSFDGRWYEIDLDEDNSDDLHALISRYVPAARRRP
ncbi:MAG: Lsr2 family protein [Actinobacteria bacterium]|nr:Lsr2 family protein [Actinomycetota bacterium]MCA1720436.1 Lsr2 family protein [Actinomycetota bacterium]